MNKLKRILFLAIVCMCSLTMYAQYDIDQFFERGRRLLIDGKYSSAIEVFNILPKLDSTLYDAYFFRGIAKYNLGDFIGAEDDFNESLRINPLYTSAYHYRAITLSRTGKYDLALKDLAEAVDLRPSYNGLYFSRGVTYFLSQQIEKAISDFNRFLMTEPKVADAYLNRGACYLYLGDTLKALNDYNKAISINTFDPEGYVRRSRLYSMQNNNSAAIKDLDEAIKLDSLNTFAYFNRALIRYEELDFNAALKDLNKVLEHEPGNALTLYNRALIRNQIGEYNGALDDYDRVISVNPNNVLAYFNRAGVFIELKRYSDALEDFTKSIELYPDFAKAYMNRAYVNNQLGNYKAANSDSQIAQMKVAEYKAKTGDSVGMAIFADTTKKYNNLLALDADFAKEDFNDELLQHRDIDINLKPLFKFNLTPEKRELMALELKYENEDVNKFSKSVPLPIELNAIKRREHSSTELYQAKLGDMVDAGEVKREDINSGKLLFAYAILEGEKNQYNSAIDFYNKAVEKDPSQTFFYINRGAVQADMIEFIASMENNVQMLTLDNMGAAKTRVQDYGYKNYDYTSAIDDMTKASSLMPEFPFVYYNLGNLYCLQGELPQSIDNYSKAIELFPTMSEAYYNRGLVLIYLKDRAKGCIDLSKSGELGIPDAYNVIKKYCVEEEIQ